MPITQLELPPFDTPLVVGPTGKMQKNWIDWTSLALLDRIQRIGYLLISPIALTLQSAAIGVTSLIPAAKGRLYRVTWYIRITAADGVASSVQLSFQSTDGGVAISQSGAAVTGDTTATVQSGTALIKADAGSLISYSTAYSSNTANKMNYSLDILTELMN